MAGTAEGGRKAAQVNKERHGEDFYRELGRRGGSVRSPMKGFGANRERAKIAGAKGGRISRRTK
jgi:general stress protein YciG